jgi:hypothetical protein
MPYARTTDYAHTELPPKVTYAYAYHLPIAHRELIQHNPLLQRDSIPSRGGRSGDALQPPDTLQRSMAPVRGHSPLTGRASLDLGWIEDGQYCLGDPTASTAAAITT